MTGSSDGQQWDDDSAVARLLSVDVGDAPDRGPGRGRGRGPGRGIVSRARRRAGSTPPLRSTFSLVVLVVTGLVLVSAGVGVIRTSTQGELFSPVTDPSAPGFEALVEPTPTLAVLHEIDGALDAVTVLTLPQAAEGGGGVVSIPAGVAVAGGERLAALHDPARPQVIADGLGELLGVAIGEVTVATPDRWRSLVAPVGPLVIDNSDPLNIEGERVPVGRVSVSADLVGGYLAATADGESDLARLFRHGLFWDAWLEAVGVAEGPDAVPGEVHSGLGRFVRHLAGGPIDIEVLPVIEAPPNTAGPVFRPDAPAVAALMAELVPLPASPAPGARPRVRVLNGTEELGQAADVAPRLAVAGVSVVLVGNATSLDHATTTIVHVSPDHQDEARAIRDLLGVGRVVQEARSADATDITVTLGADHG